MNVLVCLALAGHLVVAAEPGSTADLIGTYVFGAETLERAHSTCDACESGEAKRRFCVRQEKDKLIGACTDLDRVVAVLQSGHGFTVQGECDKGVVTRWTFTRASAANVYKGVRRTENGVCKDGKVVAPTCACTYALDATKSSDTIGDG